MPRVLALLLLAWLGLPAVPVAAQEGSGEPAAAAGPADPLGRDTPQGSAQGFLEAAEAEDWERAAAYLDLRYLRGPAAEMSGTELAQMLDMVVQRAGRIDLGGFSDRPEGDRNDRLPPFRDLIGTVETRDGPVDLWFQRVPGDAPDQRIWKVSNASVESFPRLAAKFGYPDWIEAFREWFPLPGRFLGVEAWKWALGLGLVLAAWPLLYGFLLLLARSLTRPDGPGYPELRRLLTGPLLALLLVLLFGQILRNLGLGLTGQRIASAYTLLTALSVWLVFSLITLVQNQRRRRFEAAGRSDAAVLGQPIARALKLLVLVLALLFWLSNLGVNITTMLAGLGVGGVALALAMQKPIEDLLGAISLYSQRQIEAGDLVRYRDVLARVEEIGLRTTRLRTPQNTVLSVPNLRLAYEDLENISARQRIMYEQMLRLQVDSSPAQVRAIVAELEAMLRQHEHVDPELLRVHFRQFGEYAIEVQMQTNVRTTAFDDYLAICQELNLRTLEIVERHGARLATPEGGLAQATRG